MDPDEFLPEKKIMHEIGCELYLLSIEELEARIALMKTEIKRLEISIEIKKKSRHDADAIFRI
ncbi:MAG: DUF1192 domain-containing protein [Fimbriimonadaceae bacterium]|nr:DUF1192 domain-containing protein [Alphaproteobacteria bacterium]